jgi:hypothetical protein
VVNRKRKSRHDSVDRAGSHQETMKNLSVITDEYNCITEEYRVNSSIN